MLRALCTWQRWISVCRPKVLADRAPERLGAVDDEQPAERRIEAARDRIVQQGLHGDGVLGGSVEHRQRVLVTLGVDPHRGDQDDVVGDVDAVDLDDQQVQLREIGRHPRRHPFGAQRHEAARDRRLRGGVAGLARPVALGQPDRTPESPGRHVDQHQVHGPLAEQVVPQR
jgi:hypothetical protein